MDLPQKVRYRPYCEWSKEEIEEIKVNMQKSPWHTHYHIEPESGLLNDPNGFSYFNGKYHLFYQNWPYGPAHGLKQWVHMTSEDLVHFTRSKTRLLPDHKNDSHGAYSGSAYTVEDKLFLFYTGNVRDHNWVRDPLQIGAWMDKDGKIEKFDQVLIQQPSDVTEHFRDPQIFDYKDNFYAIVGGQNHDKKGLIKLYKAVENDVQNWQFLADLDFDDPASEYMIECPNLVFVDGHPVLIYSPQGLAQEDLNYDNIYPNTYKIYQNFDPDQGKLSGGGPLQNLDFGFEAYATQAFNSPDGRALAVSWIGLPDINYPTDAYDYQGALSLVKELSIIDGKLHQSPVAAINSLRCQKEDFQNKVQSSNCYELELCFKANQIAELLLFADESSQTGLGLTVDTKTGQLHLDRSQIGQQYAREFGTKRSCQIPQEDVTLNIYVDKSIVEIFVNKGQAVLTSRVFPEHGESGLQLLTGEVQGYFYEMR